MLIFIWILTSILVFSIIILVHEFGHFKTARFFWVKVEEFWLGIPPKAKKLWTDKHWTEYTLNRLPLGWFVRLKWEHINTFLIYDKHKNLLDNHSLEKAILSNEKLFDSEWEIILESEKKEVLKLLQDNYAQNSLLTKKPWQQAIIILAWVFMNFILAIFIFAILFFIWVKPIWINDQVKINSDIKLIPTPEKALEIWLIKENPWVYLIPTPNSVAKISWIKDYDLVLKVNNSQINNSEFLKNIISKNPWKSLNLEIKRTKNNCDITKEKTCEFENILLNIAPNNEWKIWAYLVPNTEINKDFEYKYWILESIKYANLETYGQIKLTFKGIWILVQKIFAPKTKTERSEAIAQVSGPIWIVDFMTKSIWNWVIFILIIWAIISINLWVFNLLPIPALDGWRFLFIVINSIIKKIFGKKVISESVEWLIHVWFFIFLIALSLLIAYNDINKIIN